MRYGFEYVEMYNGIEITRNVRTGSYYLISPHNGTIRIFKRLDIAERYIDDYTVLESHAEAVAGRYII